MHAQSSDNAMILLKQFCGSSLKEMDLSSRIARAVFGDSETEKIRSRVVTDSIQVVLGEGSRTQVDIGIQDALLAGVEGFNQLLTIRTEDHAEATAWGTGIGVVLQETFLPVLLGQDLGGGHDEASAFHSHDLREAITRVGRDVPLPRAAVSRHVPDERPAGHVDVCVLPVGVVSEQELGMLPAVKTRHLAERGLDCRFQTFVLSIAIVCAFDVSRLDLAAMVHNGSGWVDEGLFVFRECEYPIKT